MGNDRKQTQKHALFTLTLMNQNLIDVVFRVHVLCVPDAEVNGVCRFSSSTEQSTASRLLKRHRRRKKQRPPRLERVLCFFYHRMHGSEFLLFCFLTVSIIFLQASSFSSVTDSTMSLNIITVTLNMGKYVLVRLDSWNFLLAQICA